MIIVDKSIKDRFFDRARVQQSISRKNLRVLSKAGAFVRQRARTKLRRRKRSAIAGQPPSVHSSDSFATLKNILFALHRDNESVVIGPRFVKRLRRSSRQTVPELLEDGGTAQITMTKIGDKWLPGNRGIKGAPTKQVTAHYAGNPFMGPSLREEAAAGTISSLYLYG